MFDKKAWRKKWEETNREHVQQYRKEYNLKHREEKRNDAIKRYYSNIELSRQKGRDAYYKRKNKVENTRLQRVYNITLEQYNIILKNQNNKCAICDIPQSECIRRFDVDHNHHTKEIRGLLCPNCNKGIGLFGESIEILQNAIQYLGKTKEVDNGSDNGQVDRPRNI
jgi:hypothetical protein